MAGSNTIQTVGNFTASLVHPLVLAGAAITLDGFKLEETFFNSVQQVMNSKIVALVGGGSATITNAIKIGKVTFNCTPVAGGTAAGSIPDICRLLQSLADSQGGILRVSSGINGSLTTLTFIGLVLESCQPLIVAGNDLPSYQAVFNYASYL